MFSQGKSERRISETSSCPRVRLPGLAISPSVSAVCASGSTSPTPNRYSSVKASSRSPNAMSPKSLDPVREDNGASVITWPATNASPRVEQPSQATPSIKNDDKGNEDSGSDDSGEPRMSNDDSGNDDSGAPLICSDDSGNDDSGRLDKGNDDSGNDDSGVEAKVD